jgi:hypothetical protein
VNAVTAKNAIAPPPTLLDGARVLHYAISARGGFYRIGDKLVAAMAICRYDGDSKIYLFKCAADWDVFHDADWDSVEECMQIAAQQAEAEAPLTWIVVPRG